MTGSVTRVKRRLPRKAKAEVSAKRCSPDGPSGCGRCLAAVSPLSCPGRGGASGGGGAAQDAAEPHDGAGGGVQALGDLAGRDAAAGEAADDLQALVEVEAQRLTAHHSLDGDLVDIGFVPGPRRAIQVVRVGIVVDVVPGVRGAPAGGGGLPRQGALQGVRCGGGARRRRS